MNYYLASRELIGKALNFDDKSLGNPAQDPTGLTPSHAHWMLLQIQANTSWSNSKKGRWLGWAQAVLCQHGFFELDEMKALNRVCSCDDGHCPQYNTLHVHVAVPELSEEARGILHDIKNFRGMEVHRETLTHPAWQEVLESGLVDQGPFRGPDNAFCRVALKGEPNS